MDALTEFIHTARDSRELKRALAVNMVRAGDSWAKTASVLAVSEALLTNGNAYIVETAWLDCGIRGRQAM